VFDVFCESGVGKRERQDSMKNQKAEKDCSNMEMRRRDFLKVAGTAIFVVGGRSDFVAEGALVRHEIINDSREGVAVSAGYLLVDTKKCQGCVSCMLACSLVHEGVESLSLSRIQVIQDPFQKWPDDVSIEQCRQCVDPECVKICPAGALEADPEFGYVRMVDKEICIGCGTCIEACPYLPRRILMASDKDYGVVEKVRKCDLCAGAPFHWDSGGGGPKGKQACVEVCPVGAIEFTVKTPVQEGDGGYKVNLRGESWGKLGYPTS